MICPEIDILVLMLTQCVYDIHLDDIVIQIFENIVDKLRLISGIITVIRRQIVSTGKWIRHRIDRHIIPYLLFEFIDIVNKILSRTAGEQRQSAPVPLVINDQESVIQFSVRLFLFLICSRFGLAVIITRCLRRYSFHRCAACSHNRLPSVISGIRGVINLLYRADDLSRSACLQAEQRLDIIVYIFKEIPERHRVIIKARDTGGVISRKIRADGKRRPLCQLPFFNIGDRRSGEE